MWQNMLELETVVTSGSNLHFSSKACISTWYFHTRNPGTWYRTIPGFQDWKLLDCNHQSRVNFTALDSCPSCLLSDVTPNLMYYIYVTKAIFNKVPCSLYSPSIILRRPSLRSHSTAVASSQQIQLYQPTERSLYCLLFCLPAAASKKVMRRFITFFGCVSDTPSWDTPIIQEGP